MHGAQKDRKGRVLCVCDSGIKMLLHYRGRRGSGGRTKEEFCSVALSLSTAKVQTEPDQRPLNSVHCPW